MKSWRVIGVALLAMVFLGNVIPPSVLAATPDQGINLQISPLPIELNAQPGSSVGADLRVRNAGSQTEKLQVRLLKVTEDDNGGVHLTDPKPSDEWVKWVSFSRTTFDAPSNQWQTVHMTVKLPKTAAFGYYYAVEFLRATAEPPQGGKEVARGAVATFILLNAESPGAVRAAQVVSFTSSRKMYEFLPANFTVKVRSTGNVHVAPHGNVFISKGSKQVGSIEINSDQGNVLPKGSRFFSSAWKDGFPHYETKMNGNQPVLDKNGQPETNLTWDFSKVNRLRYGHYTAKLVMVYDDGSRDIPIEANLQFWVVPWRVIIALLVVGILVSIGLWSSFRKVLNVVRRRGKKAPRVFK